MKNQKVIIMGLGLHGGGVSATRWFAKQGAKVLVTDLKNKKDLSLSLEKLKPYDIQYVFGKHRKKDFEEADLIIKNPGVPKDSPYLSCARKKNIPIENDMSIFFRLCPAPIIGVTGSKGKSTTATLLYFLLKVAGYDVLLAGNIRKSPFDIINKIKNKTIIVLELSSWQLEDMEHIRKSPWCSIITNIVADHLNRYNSMRQYENAKKIIFKYQQENDISIFNYDNARCRKIGFQSPSRRYWFSQKEFKNNNGTFIKNNKIFFREKNKESFVGYLKDIRLPGRHNRENILSALTVAKLCKINNTSIKKVLRSFKGIPGRMEFVRSWRGIKFYNDTTATAPAATIAALEAFNRQVILIAGGSDKKLPYRELATNVRKFVKKLVLLEGNASLNIKKQCYINGYKNYVMAKSMKQAVKKAINSAQRGDLVILSPAAASFGMFDNEFDRGDQFVKEVNKLS